MNILEVTRLTKHYGAKSVLKDVSFSVTEGSIFGFVGKNGAGKTTTMKMILGLETIDQGEIQILQEPVRFGSTNTNRFTGYLPDVPAFYEFMSPREYLTLCGEVAGMAKAQVKQRVGEMLALVELSDDRRKISGFSRGMKQRLGIAQALLNKPKLLICDEPTSALDPNGRREFLDLLKAVRNETTILFSTHILADVEQICDHVGILDQGKMKECGSIAALKSKYNRKQLILEFKTATEKTRFSEILRGKTTAALQEVGNSIQLEILNPMLPEIILSLLAENQIVPLIFQQTAPSLEEIYLEVVK